MGHHVFISYSRQDQPYARELADDLRTHGFEPWRDEHIEHGERWWWAIHKAVQGCAEGGRDDTSPVSQFSPKGDSPYDVADMAGNVWEWCADWYDKAEYKRRAVGGVVDPKGPQKGTSRVVRGGSFYSYNVSFVRCPARDRGSPGDRSDNIGFRVVLLPTLNSELSAQQSQSDLVQRGETEAGMRETDENPTMSAGPRFVDNGDGTVVDTEMNLMWAQSDVGGLNFEAATEYCNILRLAGYEDWRLPKISCRFRSCMVLQLFPR